MKKIIITCLFLLIFIDVNLAYSTPVKELRILRITPQGDDVPLGRQIVIEFNRPVVPIGKMERDAKQIPIDVTPQLNCQWRWLNSSSLACNLDEKNALQAATKYQISVRPGIKAQDQATIAQTYIHHFTTERADVNYAWIDQWKAPGSPVIFIGTNQAVTLESLQQHLYFVTHDQSKAKVAVKLSLRIIKDEINHNQNWVVEPATELSNTHSWQLQLFPGLHSNLGQELSTATRNLINIETFPQFKFLGIECVTNDNQKIMITTSSPQAANKLCNPLEQIYLVFNTPVYRSQIKKNVLFSPSLEHSKAGGDIWLSDNSETSNLVGDHPKDFTYSVWLPWVKAATKYDVTIKEKPFSWWGRIKHWVRKIYRPDPSTNLTDQFGRSLMDPIQLSFVTDHRKPNFVMPYHHAIMEKNTDSELPVYVNNLKSINFKYRKITQSDVAQNQLSSTAIPQVEDVQFAIPLGVRKMLNQQSGAIYGILDTQPHVEKYAGEYSLFAEVTPYQIQVKLGHYNTLVWVTDLASGQVVNNAKVTIYQDNFDNLSAPQHIFGTQVTNSQGIALLPGTQDIDPQLQLSQQWDASKPHLFIRVDKDQDIGLIPISADFAINTWQVTEDTNVGTSYQQKYGHLTAWGTTAQGIYRVGDTIQYKLYVRNQDNHSLTTPPAGDYTLTITDAAGKLVAEIKQIQLSKFGAYQGEFTLAKQAAVGWYQFQLTAVFTDPQNKAAVNTYTLNPMRVLVSDFTPVPFKVTNELNGDLFSSGQTLSLSTYAKLHSGGAYTNALARVTAIIEGTEFTSKNPLARGFTFSSYNEQHNNQQIYQKITELNDQGALSTKIILPKTNILYGKLKIESAVQDDRGKYIAALAHADYIGVDRFVGLRATQWYYQAKQAAELQYLVVDAKGNPVTGSQVDITIELQQTDVAKIKDSGNAYTSHYNTSWKAVANCHGVSTNEPLSCKFIPQIAGDYRITATVKDSQGRIQTTQLPLWVAGSEYVLWNQANENYLPILPERTDYHVGDVARYLVKNPFPGAKALITIERFGVIDSFVTTLNNSAEIIEFPIKPEYLPGFYLSVVITSPRVAKASPNGQIDLGKPTFKMGYLAVPLKDPYKEMLVTAATDHEVYRPRDKVILKLHAQPKVAKAEPIEITVAVLDEAVFDLIASGKKYFDPYQGFYQLENLDLRNYSLLTRLIGRQKFEKKGANPGGDGGVDLGTRNIFKFISYWNPSIETDLNGNATVEFTAPDNLTGWLVLALAVTPTDRMGLGEAHFKVNRPTEIRPVMPNQITEGDNFTAGFSVMNRTDKTRNLKVNITASGTLATDKFKSSSTLNLAPYKRSTVWLPIYSGKVSNQPAGAIHFTATAGDEFDHDSLEVAIPVNKYRSLETAASYGSTTEDKVSEVLQVPDKIYTDVGKLVATVAPSIVANLEGAFKYIKDYPYLCWEQILTKGVMAADYQQLKTYLPTSFSWAASTTLAKESLSLAANFQAPNGGMAFFEATDEYADPYLSAYTAIAFAWLKEQGYAIPAPVENKLHEYLLNFLRHDLAPDYYNEGMNVTVRAVSLAALAKAHKVTLQDLERYQPYVAKMDLLGKAFFIQAALTVKDAQPAALEVAKMILAQANQSSGKFIFSEQLDDAYLRILASPLRENCAVLDSFIELANTAPGKELVGDIPEKLVRTIMQTRKNRDHWENTQENIFCMRALANYSRHYEQLTPHMTVTAKLDNKVLGTTTFKQFSNPALNFNRPLQAQDRGKTLQLSFQRQGQGRLYYTATLSYAPIVDSSTAINAGIEVKREYSVQRDSKWLLLNSPLQIKRGDLVRIDIYLSLPAARNFVVVDDPVPGGLEPVNRDLATASTIDADQGKFVAAAGSIWFKFNDWIDYDMVRWSFYHQELRHDAARFYSDYLPAGNYHLSYTAQAIASGTFNILPTIAQEMYNPDIYGKDIAQQLLISNA